MQKKGGHCYIVSGLQYGDEGKGTVVDYLVYEKKASIVVRYGGGPQAAHHVVKPDGVWHCFSHYGSGMFWQKCITILSKYMIIYPQTLDRQDEILSKKTTNPRRRLKIDYECFIITPYHQMMSRVMEILRSHKKGSTGLGVGQTAEEAYQEHCGYFPKTELYQKRTFTTLQVKDLLDEQLTRQKLTKILQQKKKLISNLLKNPIDQLQKVLYKNIQLQENQISQLTYDIKKLVIAQQLSFFGPNSPDNLENTLQFYKDFTKKYNDCFCNSSNLIKEYLDDNQTIVFEGSQGALLDVIYGFYPHTTKTICSTHNADAILRDLNVSPKVTKIGVMRCYSHRHGQGPFVPFNKQLTEKLPELHNRYSKWQGSFKIGFLDKVAIMYGVSVFQPDLIAVTNLDRIMQFQECLNIVCTGYKVKQEDLNIYQKSILNSKFKFRTDKDKMIMISDILKVKEIQSFKNNDLARILNKCEPVLEKLKQIQMSKSSKFNDTHSKNAADLLNFIQLATQKKICLLSFSPTYQGKMPLIQF